MIKPEIDKRYVINHSSGLKIMIFIGQREISGYRCRTTGRLLWNARTRYTFRNISTGREIELKSTAKIKREVLPLWCDESRSANANG